MFLLSAREYRSTCVRAVAVGILAMIWTETANAQSDSSGGGMIIGGPLDGTILPGGEGGMVVGGPLDGSILPGRQGGMVTGGPLDGSIMPGEQGGMVIGGPLDGSIMPGRQGGMIVGGPLDGSNFPRRPRSTSYTGDDGGAVLAAGIVRLISRVREGGFRKKLDRLIADGDCQGAARYAQQKERWEAVGQVARLCSLTSSAPMIVRVPPTAVGSAPHVPIPRSQIVPQVQALAAPVPMKTVARPGPSIRNVEQSFGVSPEVRRKWQRYYAALIESGKTAQEARAMADREFGPIG